MRKPFKIGQKEYKFKKDAIAHYRAILNSYDFDQSLNSNDFEDLIVLIDHDYLNYLAEIEESADQNEANIENELELSENNDAIEEVVVIENIKVSKVQFNTKCFEVFYSDQTSMYISYLMMLNNSKYTSEKLFCIACRNSIHEDIRSVKQSYFAANSVKGQVKCQETGILSRWEELVVDHRQPNTFSVILDRFKEVVNLDLDAIEYISNEKNHIVFEDGKLTESFRKYHSAKATLRIVRRDFNSSRSGLARLKRTSKDLTIK